MMKWFTIILGVYMTVLAILPCKDKDDNAIATHQTSVSSKQQKDSGSCQETCPPFCTCSCCSTTRTLSAVFTVLTIHEQHIAGSYSPHRVEPVRKQALPIWQPPQLS